MLIQLGDFFFRCGKLGQFLLINDGNDRRLVSFSRLHARISGLIEESKKPVVVFLANGVVFVIVALGAFHRQSHPDHGSRFDTVDDVFNAKLLGDRPALVCRSVVAVESGREVVFDCFLGQQVAGKLLDRELVKRQIAVVGIDHPISPAPHVSRSVRMEHTGVTVSSHVHPIDGHPLAEVRRCK